MDPESPTPKGTQGAERAEGRLRQVRSFVLRGGRLTVAQQRALDEYWPAYGIEPGIEPGAEILDLQVTFGNEHPVIADVGFGNGDSTWQMARDHPQENYLGIEVHRPGVGHLLMKIEEHALRNVRIACADATEFFARRLHDSSLAGVRIYFPDPWPKKRHHKRRLVQAGFVGLIASKLRAGGVLHLATDWTPYAEHMLEVLAATPAFTNLCSEGGYCPRPPWRPLTRYEQRGNKLGHAVHDLIFRKTGADLHG